MARSRLALLALALVAGACGLPAFGEPDHENQLPLSEAEAASSFVAWHATRTDPGRLAEHCAAIGWGDCDGLELPAGHRVAVRCSFTLPRYADGPKGDARVLVVEHASPGTPAVLGQIVVDRGDSWKIAARPEDAALLTSWDPATGNSSAAHTTAPGGELDDEMQLRHARLQEVIAASCDESRLFAELLMGGHVEHGFDPDLPAGVYERVLTATPALRDWAEIRQPLDVAALGLDGPLRFGFRDDLQEVGADEVVDDRSWEITVPASRPILGGETVDVLSLLADEENERLDIEITEDRTCVEPLGPVDGLTRADGVARLSIQPRHVTWCGQWFAIDLYIELEAPHAVRAIGVDVGDALRPTDGSEG